MEENILEILRDINPYAEITKDTLLLEEGILESMSILLLISELEKRYNIEIPLDKIAENDLVDINAISNMVRLLMEKSHLEK